ncbi:Fis family transcriptional regulator [Desulfomarina profundi]|uniref:Fis family transcriptional regulator n=1 Tax=Desulfomarina profundi TaxID=2772557 RepID=A0A8D5FL63_9BACT|nr:sigma 54-interacting transcriptional regulator [Desulfomarina profundi]BCL60239.1 Fis family transcriptional regulator [Desulfomarina profundi]
MQDHERDLLNKIREAAFANPFGRTRSAIDLAVTGLSSTASNDTILAQLIERVGETIDSIKKSTTPPSKSLSEDDRQLLRFAVLFHTFHLFCDSFDEHIQKQIEKGDDCCHIDFASDMLGLLAEHGIEEKEAIRFFSLFFQMRRAFYFINGIAGKSECVMHLRRSLWNNVFTSDIRLYDRFLWDRMEDFSTMILGETGTGKGLAAAAIGRSGYIPFNPRTGRFRESFAKTFISINLSQFPEQLIESELFGHKKGAFTGAVETHKGIFSRCSPNGAIFLDEIGEVSIPVQIKLLQVLQDRVFTPVGSHKREKFQGRVIAATNRLIEQSRKDGTFRDDFYYRLCSDIIEVPPLRQRLREHPAELRAILKIIIKRIIGSADKDLEEKTTAYIREHQPEEYHWPGNIRELEQCVRRFILNSCYQWQQPLTESDSEAFLADINNGSLSATELLSRYCKILYEKSGTYEAVSQQTRLDRRTVKKYILLNNSPDNV